VILALTAVEFDADAKVEGAAQQLPRGLCLSARVRFAPRGGLGGGTRSFCSLGVRCGVDGTGVAAVAEPEARGRARECGAAAVRVRVNVSEGLV
jgi:hypothetical protein